MISGIFIVLALLCMGYYVIAASYAGIASSFLSFWIAAFAGFAFFAFLFSSCGKKLILSHIPHAVRIAALCVMILGVMVFVTVEGLIISRMNASPTDDVEYLIVLGAQVRGNRVTKSLAKRLDAAFDYSKAHQDVEIIVSGGQGKGENLSEAEAMQKYLVNRGMDEDRIILEDKSTTTKQNLKFSREKMSNKDARAAVVTNNFHVFRAEKIAKKLGYNHIQGLAGKSDKRLLINYMVRELVAVLKEFFVRNI